MTGRGRVLVGFFATIVVVLATVGVVAPAQALTSATGTVELNALSAPDVLRAVNGAQPAGNLRFQASDASNLDVVNGEKIIIEVSDGLGEDCDQTGKFFGFAGVPTISLTGSNATVTATLRGSTGGNRLRTPATGCNGFTPATNDQLVLTISDAPNAGGTIKTITISNIQYIVGSQAAVGDTTVLWADDVPPTDATATPTNSGGDTAPTEGESNAYITNLDVTATSNGAVSVGSDRSFGSFTFTETNFDATTPAGSTGGVCLNLLSPFRMTFAEAGTATVTSGDDHAGTPTILNSKHTIRIPVTASDPATKSVYVLSGVRVDATQTGKQDMNVTQCDSTGSPLAITAASENNPSVTEYTDAIGTTAAPPVVDAVRLAGDNRDDTARRIAVDAFDCSGASPSYAIIARDDDFSDALAADYVAGQLRAPILLVAPHGAVPSATATALHDLGITHVVVMGGPNAVGDDVVAALAALHAFDCSGLQRNNGTQFLTVTRLQGADRFETAATAAAFLVGSHAIGTLDTNTSDATPAKKTAILANGRNFPDAMLAGPMAFQGSTCEIKSTGTNCEGFPLVLSDGQSSALPGPTLAFLASQGITQLIVVGGASAVPTSVTDSLASAGIAIIRLGGNTRQETATTVATFEYGTLQFGVVDLSNTITPITTVALARGDFFTDALALGPLAGLLGEPILLTVDPNTVGATTDGFLASIAHDYNGATGGANGGLGFSVDTIHIAGGLGAVSSAAQTEALDALS